MDTRTLRLLALVLLGLALVDGQAGKLRGDDFVSQIYGTADESAFPYLALFETGTGCEACKYYEKIWPDVTAAVAKEGINTAIIDCDDHENSWACLWLRSRPYPTIKLFLGDKIYNFPNAESRRTVDDIKAFAFGGYATAESFEFPEKPVLRSEIVDANGKVKVPLTGPQTHALERQPGLLPHLPEIKAPTYFSPVVTAARGVTAPPATRSYFAPALGPNTAPVKVFLFSDFACSNCKRAAEPLKYLVSHFPGDVQLVFKQHPLPSHKKALPAALAGAAAAEQGKFWEFHDVVWNGMGRLEPDDLEKFAVAVGVDVDQYRRDVKSDWVRQQVEYERALAEELALDGTPGIVINGAEQKGWGSYEGVAGHVRRALQLAKEVEKEGFKGEEVAKEATRRRNAKFAEYVFGTAPGEEKKTTEEEKKKGPAATSEKGKPKPTSVASGGEKLAVCTDDECHVEPAASKANEPVVKKTDSDEEDGDLPTTKSKRDKKKPKN